ncbi:hypothetical protein HKK72_03635 [Actinomadura sp. HBU206391]|nr:hypothetical protein [Actinomadura sp. HBU206391]
MRRSFLRILLAVGTFLLAVAVLPGHAYACSCGGPPGDQDNFTKADAVFTGRFVRQDDPGRMFASDAPVTLVFDVSAVEKGEVARRQGVITPPATGACGLAAGEGGNYLVFAYRDGDVLRTDICAGTRLAERPLSVPFAQTRPPSPGSAGVEDGLPIGVMTAVAGAMTAMAVISVLLGHRSRRASR